METWPSLPWNGGGGPWPITHKLPPLSALRVFEAAGRRGGFTAAAAELGVTPSAVSHGVRTLEDALAVPLFHRDQRGMRLTPAGEEAVARGKSRLRRPGPLRGEPDEIDDAAPADRQRRANLRNGMAAAAPARSPPAVSVARPSDLDGARACGAGRRALRLRHPDGCGADRTGGVAPLGAGQPGAGRGARLPAVTARSAAAPAGHPRDCSW